MRRSIRFLPVIAAVTCAACGLLPNGEAKRGDGSIALDVFKESLGTWAWANGDSTCRGNVHTLTFSPDRSAMLLTHREPLDTVTGQTVAKYRVVSSGNQILPGLANVIRARLDDETRTTDDGKPVVWDLVLMTPNRYHWHRTDWPDGAVTKPLIRCDGERAMEQWQEGEGT